MKKLFVTSIIGLFAMSVNAQTAMPQELTCTEEAFNFSFNVGANWRISTPKMGPVETLGYEPGYNPAWWLKANPKPAETNLPPLFETAFGTRTTGYLNSLKLVDKANYPFPVINFSPMPDYTLPKPLSFSQSVPIY